MTRDSAAVGVRAALRESATVLQQTATACAGDLVLAAERIAAALGSGQKLLLCGNGGSAAECQHLAAEFVNLLDRRRERRGLAAIALTTDGALLTATANDRGFESIFARQVEALGRPGDILLALTTSGSSANILRALEAARAQGLDTILLTGAAGGAAFALAHLGVRVPSSDTQQIQEAHLALEIGRAHV